MAQSVKLMSPPPTYPCISLYQVPCRYLVPGSWYLVQVAGVRHQDQALGFRECVPLSRYLGSGTWYQAQPGTWYKAIDLIPCPCRETCMYACMHVCLVSIHSSDGWHLI